ncbi:MAG: tRNA pseudouridine synthase A [Planctomycetes bacterium]|nr:tRNA pseudouridine synthase A [Planctomycetota bacterium]
MPRFALTIEYDGRAFQGTQAQGPGLRTLQGVLEAAATRLDGQEVQVRLCSRLDAEVSALALTGDCLFGKDWHPATLALAFTGNLPADVAVRKVARVADDWSAKIHARSKTYRYRVVQRGVRPVLDRDCLWVRQLDHVERLHELAALLVGDLDLSGFACLRGDDTHWLFRITGQGFLYKQVRGLVGAMVHVAQGRAECADFIAAMQAGRGARRFGNIVPGHGLALECVSYDPEPEWVVI